MSFFTPAFDLSELHQVARRAVGTNFQMCCLVRRDRGGWITFSLIIDGKVGVKHGAQVARFTESGVVFTDGTELDADAVIFA